VTISRSSMVAALALTAGSLAPAQQYVISTYAGVSASICPPSGIATDVAGNVYIASDNCVFKLDTNGVLTRAAGNSRGGYSGDGGPA
jgi:hypothetical protein